MGKEGKEIFYFDTRMDETMHTENREEWKVGGVTRGVSLQEKNMTLCAQKLKMRCAPKTDAAAVRAKLKAVSKLIAVHQPQNISRNYSRIIYGISCSRYLANVRTSYLLTVGQAMLPVSLPFP
jgi:hypothetical protein